MDDRVSFHLISIVDPVFTLALLVACIYSFRRGRSDFARAGLSVAGLYLFIGWMQLQRAESVIEDFAAIRGHEVQQLVVKPTLGNQLLWRSIYKYEQRFYIDAVRVGLFSESRVYEGRSIKVYNPQVELQGLSKTSVLYQDVTRFMSFSDDYVASHSGHDNVLSDIRYSNQPTGLDPLWGIQIDMDKPDQHAKFSIYRNISKQNRQRYFAMLMNDDVLKE